MLLVLRSPRLHLLYACLLQVQFLDRQMDRRLQMHRCLHRHLHRLPQDLKEGLEEHPAL